MCAAHQAARAPPCIAARVCLKVALAGLGRSGKGGMRAACHIHVYYNTAAVTDCPSCDPPQVYAVVPPHDNYPFELSLLFMAD